jgi:hypothetical protein
LTACDKLLLISTSVANSFQNFSTRPLGKKILPHIKTYILTKK